MGMFRRRGRVGGGVTHGLIVGIFIEAHEIRVCDDGMVGAIGPDVGGIHMADLDTGGSGALDGRTDLLDVGDNLLRSGACSAIIGNACGADAVQILTADRDAGNQIRKRRPVLRNRRLEGRNLVVELRLAGRRPHAEQQGGLGVDGGLDGADRGAGGARGDHGVEAGRGELVAGAGEVPGAAELGGEVDVGVVVEADVLGRGRGGQRRGGEEELGEVHLARG